MSNSIYPWQESSWQQLQLLRQRMPHAILFHGAAGIGKSDFIERFAQGLLCEAVLPDGHACGQCASCGWFSQQNHPDYRRVRPEALEDEPAEGEEGDGEAKKTAKSAKAPSKEIKIEQIRNLADFMNISTHRQGLRVVVLYPAEALNMPASNALLKTLEEPPPGTVFLLASNSLDRLLPTILSRCRKFALPMPSHAEALAWLKTQGVPDADSWLREQGGAPLAAMAQAEVGNRDDLEVLLQLLAHPSVEGALKVADKLQKVPLSAQVSWLQRWLYDVFSYKLAGNIRYYPRYQKELASLAGKIHVSRLLSAIKGANERRATADHPLSPKLFLEDMLLEYAACCA
ncbi:DNA polymerase III subunit delta' [Duganella sp. BJB488]|uniref:DNA polymerase III subunit delta' n=1 Tax=unclassified Duganella TaxID=2636909 RepID=UPI000E3473D7|nr:MULTISPECIES: DNA polymerase III subunit delta' [unclassified Duganella]RFP17582.1 DNA polymerase III subunit delta' [Duganella sp. BJB489]RFP22092.1 DNA polymerase III subunit delta' [Duganella sp. BJB488]RFP37426.1 DNA polymerase III subunit delta' [Duganella sp. BJB480]